MWTNGFAVEEQVTRRFFRSGFIVQASPLMQCVVGFDKVCEDLLCDGACPATGPTRGGTSGNRELLNVATDD